MSTPSAVTAALEDVRAQLPSTHVWLSRVGISGVEKVIRVQLHGRPQPFMARLECFLDPGPAKRAHTSRFDEVVNDAIGDVVLGEAQLRAETLAQHIAERIRDHQGARRAEVRIEARYPEYKAAPESGIQTQESYSLLGTAVASDAGTRRLIGVRAQGMTACPCAQRLVEAGARVRLQQAGFADEQIAQVFDAVPVATHDQRGLGTLYIGLDEDRADSDLPTEKLLEIVEGSMSSEIYELMKRTDEGAVVERAHRRPRFVEDCVREMIRGVVEDFPELGDEAFVFARQENLEAIHQHNVVAERFGLLGEIRAELTSHTHAAHHVSVREWLDGRA